MFVHQKFEGINLRNSMLHVFHFVLIQPIMKVCRQLLSIKLELQSEEGQMSCCSRAFTPACESLIHILLQKNFSGKHLSIHTSVHLSVRPYVFPSIHSFICSSSELP